MDLKYSDIKWTDKGLMYVTFKWGKQELKWFPKWEDVGWIIYCSQWTEEMKHDGRLGTFFEIAGCELLVNSIIDRMENVSPELSGNISDTFARLRGTLFKGLAKNAER